jgi:xylulokinase
LEGVVFGFRHHIETFEESGLEVFRVFAADGGAASDLWLQIAADAIGRPVTRIDRHPGSSLGAAFVAGMGVGLMRDWAAIADYVAAGRIFEPQPRNRLVLEKKYRLWRDLYARLESFYPELGQLA